MIPAQDTNAPSILSGIDMEVMPLSPEAGARFNFHLFITREVYRYGRKTKFHGN